MLEIFTNREWAMLIVLLGVVAFAFVSKSIRPHARDAVTAFFAPSLVPHYIALLVLVGVATTTAWWLGLWSSDQLGPVVVWAVVGGFPLLFQLSKNTSERRRARRILLQAFTASALAAFFLGLHSYSIPAEILLVMLASFLGVLEVVARASGTAPQVARWTGVMIAVLGLALVVDTLRNVGIEVARGSFDIFGELRAFAVPIWLTAAVFPYTVALAVWDGYSSMFRRAEWARERQLTWRERVGAVLGLGLRPLRIGELRGHEHMRFGREAEGLRASRRLVRQLHDDALLPRRIPAHVLRARTDLDETLPPFDENTDAYLGDPEAYYNEVDLDSMAFDEIVNAGQDGDERVLVGLAEVKDRVETRHSCFQNAGGEAAPGTERFIRVISDAAAAFAANDMPATARIRGAIHAIRAEFVQDFVATRRAL